MWQWSSCVFLILLCFLFTGCNHEDADVVAGQQQVMGDSETVSPQPDAQNGVERQTSGFAAYVPEDAVMVIDLKLEEMLKKLDEESFRPNRLIDYAREQIGLDANEIESLTIVLMPEDMRVFVKLFRQEFLFASIIRFKHEMDPDKIVPFSPDKILDISIAGKPCHGYSNHALEGRHVIVKYWVDKKTLIIGPQARVEKMVAETAGTGPLARLMSEVDSANHCTVLFAFDPMRDEIIHLFEEAVGQADPELQHATEALKEIDLMMLGVNLEEDPMSMLKIVSSNTDALDHLAASPQQLLELFIAVQMFSLGGFEKDVPRIIQVVQPVSDIQVERSGDSLLLLIPQPEGYWEQ